VRTRVCRVALSSILIVSGASGLAQGQGLSLDVSAGRLVFDPLTSDAGTNNVLGSLRYDRRTTWVYGSAAVPLGSSDTFWTSGGAGGRLMPAARRRLTFGADVAGQGYASRDGVSSALGTGAMLDALPFVRVSSAEAFLEASGGWRGHAFSLAGTRENRDVVEAGVRGGVGTRFRVQGDARWVRAAEGTYPFAGGTLSFQNARAQVWGQAGRWLSDTLDDVAWGAGGSLALSARASMWAAVRQEAPDPLFWNPTRRTWSIGLTQRLGPVAAPRLPVVHAAGSTVIRLRLADAPAGEIFIAGDFNNWQPVPMQREGRDWVLQLPLAPGVYHYAFRSASGEWFVPASTPGRRDDGMGGHQAVLVVS